MKKIYFLLIALLCSATMAFAYEAEIDGIYYDFDHENKTAAVTHDGDAWDYDDAGYTQSEIIIPEKVTYNGVEYSVTSIGEYAFGYCSSLTSITIPNSVTSIEGYAFFGTSWLENQPDGCVYINNCLYGYKGEMPKNTHIDIKEGTITICSGAFNGCSFLTSITIPNSVTSIGWYAFFGCSSLSSIEIPNSVTEIGTFAFSDTPWLKNQPDGCVYIGNCFYEYKGEMPENTHIDIKEGTITICGEAFNGYSSLTSITIPNSVISIGDGAFLGCSSLTSVTIGNSVTEIGDFAFYGCSSLASITIPNSVTKVGCAIFSGCSSLKSVILSENMVSLRWGRCMYDDYSGFFESCSSLTSITIPNSVTWIGERAFIGCSSLTSVTIGNSVTLIGEDAFVGCSTLDTLICEFGDDVLFYEKDHQFAGTKNLRYFEGPAKLVNSIKEEFQTQFSNTLTEVHITDGELDENGFNYINRSKKSLHTIDLAGTTNTAINDLAFYDCYKLENLMLPGNLETIGFKAVAECYQLKEINIPASVVEINDAAFEHCRSIKSITFGGQAEAKSFASRMKRAVASGDVALQRIGNWAFYNCHALENLVIPEGVTEVGDAAFYGCTYLDSLALPSTTQRIGDNCFALCSRMKQINVNAIEPPTIFAKTFFDVNRNILVIVPEGTREAYANDEYWGEFINVVESEDIETQIENAENANVAIYSVGGVLYVDGLSVDYQVFDVNGRLVYSGRDAALALPRGVYVVVVGDEVEKVVL